jgi:arginyl-tRNA synthetase
VAGAARRRQPHVVAAYLEELASRYFDWQEACPVMRPGSVPPDLPGPGQAGGSPGSGPRAAGDLIQARLQLASAARTVLATGLRLLGIAAPGRM